MTLEEKVSKKILNKQVKRKKIDFYWDCDLTKDIENVNINWWQKY